ncbi:MAG TPA: Flp pilus assembly protein CpaB, partial [Novosphingobium sp.]|nr:Flp pilus assembly protein CpaB [Novosphingobium sp.]
MDQRKLMLLLGAMVIAIGTALAARSLLSGSAAPQVAAALPAAVAPKGPKVLVAQRALPVGTIITADAVSFQEWPKDMVRDAYFVEGSVAMNKLVGTVVRFPITAGQPLTQGALVAPGDRGFLAAALGPGMRAITIPVSDKTSVAGFIFPGDHVDLMLTSSVKDSVQMTAANVSVSDDRPVYATETILRNLRVLATDQATETESANGKTVVHPFHNVTLEVTPKLAEKIEVAQSVGTISLVLRSIADNQSDLDHAVASGQVKLKDGASPQEESRLITAAMNRPSQGATSFSTGGDVSRFQRHAGPNTGKTMSSSTPQGQAAGMMRRGNGVT